MYTEMTYVPLYIFFFTILSLNFKIELEYPSKTKRCFRLHDNVKELFYKPKMY